MERRKKMEARGISTALGSLNRLIRALNDMKERAKNLLQWSLLRQSQLMERMASLHQPTLADYLRNYYDKRNAVAESYAYGTKKAKNTNLKQFAETIRFLEEQDVRNPEQLTEKIQELDIQLNEMSQRLNPRYAAMRGTDENRYRGEARGSEKAYGFGHIGTDEKLFVFESPIDLLSYITAVSEEWEKHSYISLGGLSEKAMKRMYTEYPYIHSIYLCLDNDEPGNERCRQFVSLIPEELSVYRLEPVKKDWNECLVAEVPVENMAKQMCWRDAREKPVPVMKMSEVEETVVQWLWYPFIPFGKVTLIQGNPGKGKTWLAMAIAAYCTNGKELPNALPIEPFNVLYQTAEDGIADTIKPRLAKCGADMTRVRFINEDEKQLSMTDDRIEKAIRQNNVRLMIMDPIQAYLGANVDMNRANEIRPLFRHLSTIAERTGCAIVLIGHLNKSSGSQSDYRSLGSIDIAAAVRSILFVEKVEKEKEQDIRVVYQQKDSLAKKENPVAFSLGEEGLKWLGEYDISIEDLLMGKAGTKKETKLEKAQKLILELLTKRKVMCLEELEAELLAYGISSRTGRDARKQLENRMSYDWCQGRKTVALTTE